MKEKKPPQTPEDVLRELNEFLLGDEPDFGSMSTEQVQEYLREAGVDPKPKIQTIRKRIAKAIGAKALKVAREKRGNENKRLTEKATDTERLKILDRKTLMERLLALAGATRGPQEAMVHMRKLEDADEEDLRSLIEDMEALAEDEDDES